MSQRFRIRIDCHTCGTGTTIAGAYPTLPTGERAKDEFGKQHATERPECSGTVETFSVAIIPDFTLDVPPPPRRDDQ